jgi:DNA (cytosine-5)-methyltransferase 1
MPAQKVVFVDVFAGCGGLSLGLLQAGLQGLFAVEKDKFAFETLSANLLDKDARHKFAWPEWLPKKRISIETLLTKHAAPLKALAGSIDLLVGGPPCQGFSSAGRRQHDDPRNKLFRSYLEIVDILKPKAVLIENVRGFSVDFDSGSRIHNYAQKLRWGAARIIETLG